MLYMAYLCAYLTVFAYIDTAEHDLPPVVHRIVLVRASSLARTVFSSKYQQPCASHEACSDDSDLIETFSMAW